MIYLFLLLRNLEETKHVFSNNTKRKPTPTLKYTQDENKGLAIGLGGIPKSNEGA